MYIHRFLHVFFVRLLLVLCVPALTCCGRALDRQEAARTTQAESSLQSDPATHEDDGLTRTPEWREVSIRGETFLTNGYIVQEPACTIDIAACSINDFGDYFVEEYPVARDSYLLREGTEYEIEVVHIRSQNPGPVIYVVGGVHGDERAGWFAATLLRGVTVSCGELYIAAPANAKGARLHERLVDGADLNRVFPGALDGNEAQKTAYAIYEDIQNRRPEFLFDLHEAIVYTEGRDFLGSTLIFSDLSLMSDLFFDLLFATESGEICSQSFGYNGPGPSGSLNATVTEQLRIPTITVETFRGYDIARRVCDQLDIVEYVLAYKGMR